MIIDLRKEPNKRPRFVFNEETKNILLIGSTMDSVNLWGLTALKQLQLSSHTSAVYAVNFFPPSTEEDPLYGGRKKYIKRLRKLLKMVQTETEEERRRTYIFIFGADMIKMTDKGSEEIYALAKLGSEGHLHVVAITIGPLYTELTKLFEDHVIPGSKKETAESKKKETKPHGRF